MKTSKKEILAAALAVFSSKGYEGALLRDISDSLGITKAALYKHFESKEAIRNAMIDYAKQYYDMHIGSISDIPVPGCRKEFQELSLAQINFTLHDETVKHVRKFLTLEQYRSEETAALATKYFISDNEERYAKVFLKMAEKGLLKCEDPKLLAFQYTAPITVLIHFCDRAPEKEAEIMEKIKAHIEIFAKEHIIR